MVVPVGVEGGAPLGNARYFISAQNVNAQGLPFFFNKLGPNPSVFLCVMKKGKLIKLSRKNN